MKNGTLKAGKGGKERKGKGRKGKLDWVKRGIRAPCGAVYPEEHGEKR